MRRLLPACLLLLVALADERSAVNGHQEDKSEEATEEAMPDLQPNGTVSGEIVGIPDSHEAMNNRDIFSSNHKSKRSYEFLLGLVKNNSRYELTRRDSANQQVGPAGEDAEAAARPADELLQLITRIASHPNHWSRVHRLLRKIDGDLTRSKKLLRDSDSRHATRATSAGHEDGDHRTETSKWSSRHRNHTGHHQDPWVSFKSPDEQVNTWGVFKTSTSGHARSEAGGRGVETARLELGSRETVQPVRKQFTYHKVTGKPLYVDRPSKAYIAVSIVAPKIESRGRGDAELEKQLRKLKPWERRGDDY